ncbi:MAG TPA: YqiA/YcfP family alpha/beta fold hydrolase, partial [Candidatus Gracilibacteria bacterium]|nr:YqiA/YcfP family alpha/beta fold hydrolase [Candidatus Gracilibacteria bacterium]
MKKVLFIHGFEASANSVWFPWLEQQLQQFGYVVVNQTWPNPKHPNFEDSMAFLEDLTRDFLPHDSIVGHSLGGFFALKLAEKRELDRLFVVAPAVGGLPYGPCRQLWPALHVGGGGE